MAVTKEAMVIILDIGKNSLQSDGTEEFFQKEKSCCMKIFQRKIFSSKKDEVGLLLMGTNQTENELNRTMEGYDNISEILPLSIPNWEMAQMLDKNVSHEGAVADWLDALIVAMDLLRREKEVKKFGNFKIVLFTTFSTYVNDDNVSFVIQGLKSMDIELVVISDNVLIPTAGDDDGAALSQGVFSQNPDKSQHQKLSEELIHKIIAETDGTLCNFEFVVPHLMNFQRKKARPWYWNSTLKIGSSISIQISSTIYIKSENHITWKDESIEDNTKMHRSVEFFKGSEKLDLDTRSEEIIKGYMVGSTPLPYDESIGMKTPSTQKGLFCLGFSPKSYVLQEFFSGNGSYLVLPKIDHNASESMLAALVDAMTQSNLALIARWVYGNGNKPKIVALLPNYIEGYPCLSQFELFYNDQCNYWEFPKLRIKKTEPTAEQLDAVDKLIDCMDLMNTTDDTNVSVEAFPKKKLIDISLQHIYETVSKRALNPKEPVQRLQGRLEEALKVPQKIKDNSAEPLKRIMELFKLEEIKKTAKRELILKLGDIPVQQSNDDGNPQIEENETVPEVGYIRNLIEVGTVTPAEDFIVLLNRGERFDTLAGQMANVVNDLIFKSMTAQTEKVSRAIMTYREQAKVYGPWKYNSWIKEFKEVLLKRNKIEFWNDVIVKHEFGLISTTQSDLVTSVSDEEAAEFYVVSTAHMKNTAAATDVPEDDEEDVFALM